MAGMGGVDAVGRGREETEGGETLVSAPDGEREVRGREW